MNHQGAKNLCAAVLVEAVKGYKAAIQDQDSDIQRSYESFFKSEWCRIYLGILDWDLTGPELINTIQAKCRK